MHALRLRASVPRRWPENIDFVANNAPALKSGETVGKWTLHNGPYKRPLKGPPCWVWNATDDHGQPGVLKFCRNPTSGYEGYVRKRFRVEAELMTKLDGRPGVLPVLDVDPSGDFEWFVTEEAQLLGDHFGEAPNLHHVVDVVASLAGTLMELYSDLEVTHRDLKPDNLFWLDGQPLLGDFGIAKDPEADGMNLTGTGHKMGPWGYIAPEALSGKQVRNWRPADVYSLTKCLWKFAMGDNFPPQGTLYVRERGTSLYPVGGKPAMELARLLEQTTHNIARERPLMRELRYELKAWLGEFSPEDVSAPPQRTSKRGWRSTPVDRQLQIADRGLEAIAEDCAHQVLASIRNRGDETGEIHTCEPSEIEITDELLQALTGGDPHWEYEFNPAKALTWPEAWPLARVICQAVGVHDEATYYAQWQIRETAHSQWIPAAPVRVAIGVLWFPRDFIARRNLKAELTSDDPSPVS